VTARGAVAYAVGLIAFLSAGLWLGGHPAKLPEFVRDPLVSSPAGLTAEAAELIEDNYFRSVGETELSNASLQGLVRELRQRHGDRFSEYFSPEKIEGFNEAIAGRFSGVGLSIVEVERGLRVVEVFARSPADRAGIAPGDTVVSVDGESLAGVNSTEATTKIKGPEGSEVTLGVLDAKSKKVRQLRLTRAEVKIPNVSSRVEEALWKLGYVRMLSFSEGAHADLAQAVRRVKRQGVDGIVLDLRGNPGGLLDEAVLSAGAFLSEGDVVVKTESRSQGDSVHKTESSPIWRGPLLVLIDRGTASAAEILAAALADNYDAPIVGTRSFGKGVFQQEEPLANGGALKLTVGEYFTPDGVNLARSRGIHPEVKVADNPETPVDEAERRALDVLNSRIGG
jgi:carboxyl-terminal processing protease